METDSKYMDNQQVNTPPPKLESELLRRAWRPLRTVIITLAVFVALSLLFNKLYSNSGEVGLLFSLIIYYPASLLLSLILFFTTILSLYRVIKIYISTIKIDRRKIKLIILVDIILSLVFLSGAYYLFFTLNYHLLVLKFLTK